MTPPGVCFSRATPFVKRRGRHVHRSPPGRSSFVDRTSRGKRPIFSPDLESERCRKFSFGNRPTIKRLVRERGQAQIMPWSPRLARYWCQTGHFLWQRGGLSDRDSWHKSGRGENSETEIAHYQPESQIQARDFQTIQFHAYP